MARVSVWKVAPHKGGQFKRNVPSQRWVTQSSFPTRESSNRMYCWIPTTHDHIHCITHTMLPHNVNSLTLLIDAAVSCQHNLFETWLLITLLILTYHTTDHDKAFSLWNWLKFIGRKPLENCDNLSSSEGWEMPSQTVHDLSIYLQLHNIRFWIYCQPIVSSGFSSNYHHPRWKELLTQCRTQWSTSIPWGLSTSPSLGQVSLIFSPTCRTNSCCRQQMILVRHKFA